MSLKICHLTSVHGRYDTRVFEKECVSLAQNGYDVILIVNDDKGDEVRKNVKTVSINYKPVNRIDRIINSKKHMLKKAIQVDADVYHFHDPELLPVGAKLLNKGKKVIYDSHEDVPRQILTKKWIPFFLRKIISFFFERYENNLAKRFTAVVVPTPHIARRFERINNNICLICNFPLLYEFKYLYEFKKASHDFLLNNTACYIGGISENRGIWQIAEATKKANIKLILAGRFEPLELQNQIVNSYKHVNYLGLLDRQSIANLLYNSAVGLATLLPTPNYLNAYPTKMFEYMASGIPVICSDFPLWKKIIEENQCGICVNPYDVDEIYKALEYIIKNPDEAKRMGDNGKKAVLEKYNWNIEEKKLFDLYYNLQV